MHCAHVSVCLPFLQPEITYQNVLLAALQKRGGKKKDPQGMEARSDFLRKAS